MTRALVTQLVEALEASWNPAIGSLGREEKANAAITAARDYLATEPSAERAELLHALSGHIGWANTVGYAELGKSLRKAADMLEADAQQAKQVPMSADDVYQCGLRGAMEDGTAALVRAVEAHHGIGGEA